MENLLPHLESLGISVKEAKVFLACLELGPSAITDIARKAGIKRQSVYHLLEPLLQRNLVNKVPRQKRILYKAASPRRVLRMLEQKRQAFEKVMPRLESMYQAQGTRPRVRFFEGKEGILEAYRDIFKTHKRAYALFSPAEALRLITPEESKELFSLMRREGGVIYDLVKPSDEAHHFAKEGFIKGVAKIKFLPPDFECATDLIVVGDKTALFSFKILMAVVIENEDIAKSQRALLKYIWHSLKK